MQHSNRQQSARSVAHDVLVGVAESDAYANLLLPARIRAASLRPDDAALATELTYGTLRWQAQYDALIEHAAERSLDDLDVDVVAALRMGVHQLMRMNVKVHAAVHESVEVLSPTAKGKRGFTNAILRRLSRSDLGDELHTIAAQRTDDEARALETSHPAWVLRAFRRALEAEGAGAELDSLLAADNASPGVQLVALPGRIEVGELAAASGGAATASPIGVQLAGGDPARLSAVARGDARVQDSGSQLAALALVAAEPVAEGELWLDMCAGPGGKAALLAALAESSGAQLVANEAQKHRVRLVERALDDSGLRDVQVLKGDGRRFAGQARFDRVLVDAPCSGLGALRRRPEARWRKDPSDIGALSTLQEELLRAALTAVKPGGIVAYVTCSPHLAETVQVVQRALRAVPEAEALDTREVVSALAVGERAQLGQTGTAVQLWPHRNGTDAMFVQLLRVAK